jgi:hypothetical protein
MPPRALVVHHEIDLADQEAESLRRYGYEVIQCSGPTANACPILSGDTCPLVETSDVLVYDAWASGDSDGSGELIDGLRRAHPGVPIVLTYQGLALASVDDEPSHGVVVMQGQPTGANLHEAIQKAIASLDAVSNAPSRPDTEDAAEPKP